VLASLTIFDQEFSRRLRWVTVANTYILYSYEQIMFTIHISTSQIISGQEI